MVSTSIVVSLIKSWAHDPVVYGHILDREGVRDVIEHEALGCKVGWNLALQDVRDGLMGGAVVRAPHEPDVQGGVPDPQAVPDELLVLLVLPVPLPLLLLVLLLLLRLVLLEP